MAFLEKETVLDSVNYDVHHNIVLLNKLVVLLITIKNSLWPKKLRWGTPLVNRMRQAFSQPSFSPAKFCYLTSKYLTRNVLFVPKEASLLHCMECAAESAVC